MLMARTAVSSVARGMDNLYRAFVPVGAERLQELGSGPVHVWKLDLWFFKAKKRCQLRPPVTILPAHFEQISRSIPEVASHSVAMTLVHRDVIRLVTVGHVVPIDVPAELRGAGSRGVLAQAPEPDVGILPRRQDELRSRELGIDLPIHERPWPVLEAFVCANPTHQFCAFASSPQFERLRIARNVSEAPVTQTDPERLGPGLVETDADDFHPRHRREPPPG